MVALIEVQGNLDILAGEQRGLKHVGEIGDDRVEVDRGSLAAGLFVAGEAGEDVVDALFAADDFG